MRILAEFVMRGRPQAIGASVLCTTLPLLNWLANAIVALVILRKGLPEGLIVLLWAILPLGMAFWFFGDPSPLIAMAGTACLAWVLRVTVSWEVTLAVAVLVSGIGSLVFELAGTRVLATIVEWYMEYVGEISAELKENITFEQAKDSIMGFFAMGQAWAMLAFLVLARWWQSQLYNPGGFRKEFQQLRLSPAVSSVIVIALVVSIVFAEQLGRWVPLLTVPLVMAALALVHWVIVDRKLSGQWVFGFYLLLVMVFQVVYPLLASLALMDSWFNFRTRFQSKGV